MRAVRAAVAAVAFLTRLPVGRLFDLDGEDVGRGAPLFPLVGAALGAAVCGLAVLLDRPLPPLVAAAVATAAGTLLTGALHLDALADTADALGGDSRERALEIMRDHRVGAYGALALVLDVVIKVAAIASLDRALAPVAAAAAVARSVPVVLGAALPYARPGAGIGRAVGGRVQAVVAVALAAGIAVAVGWWPLALVPLVAAPVLGLVVRRWLGGVTGDVLGASAELTEIAALVVAVAVA
jgi:adenosylcobinamide-GDP ribazoletransferase